MDELNSKVTQLREAVDGLRDEMTRMKTLNEEVKHMMIEFAVKSSQSNEVVHHLQTELADLKGSLSQVEGDKEGVRIEVLMLQGENGREKKCELQFKVWGDPQCALLCNALLVKYTAYITAMFSFMKCYLFRAMLIC